MQNAKEAIEACRSWEKLGLIVSAAALILLFTPAKVDYGQALDEAYILRNLRMANYENFARAFLGNPVPPPPRSNTGRSASSRRITDFLNSLMGITVVDGKFPNPTWDSKIIIEYEHPPTDGTLQDWFNWINSLKPASYFYPDWNTARLSAHMPPRGGTETTPLVRYFSLRPSIWQRFPGEYTFRAYLDGNINPDDRSESVNVRDRREDWWSKIDQRDSRSLLEEKGLNLGKGRGLIEGDVESTLREITGKTGIKNWLQRSHVWERLSRIDPLGETVVPGMRAHWSVLREKSLPAAIAFMENEQHKVGDVSLLGLQIPGQLCVVAVPLAYLFIYLSLLLDLRFLARIQCARGLGDISVAPWTALYKDRLATWSTTLSIAIAPFILSIALLLKYHSRAEGYAVIIGVVASASTGTAGFWAVRSAAAIRRQIHNDSQTV